MSDHHRRSIVKGISWRLVAFLDTSVLALVFTRSLATAFKISGLEFFTKVFLFYLHERLWLTVAARVGHDHTNHAAGHGFTLAKAVSWRFVGSLDTTFLSYLVTGNLTVSLSIGGTEFFTKILLFYIHERLWMRVGWARGPKPATRDQEAERSGR